MSESYIRGTTRPHEPEAEQGISLAGMGIPPESMKAWNVLQGFFARGETTPCAGRSEWTSNKAKDKATAIRLCGDCVCKPSCNDYAESMGETTGIWAGIDRSKT